MIDEIFTTLQKTQKKIMSSPIPLSSFDECLSKTIFPLNEGIFVTNDEIRKGPVKEKPKQFNDEIVARIMSAFPESITDLPQLIDSCFKPADDKISISQNYQKLEKCVNIRQKDCTRPIQELIIDSGNTFKNGFIPPKKEEILSHNQIGPRDLISANLTNNCVVSTGKIVFILLKNIVISCRIVGHTIYETKQYQNSTPTNEFTVSFNNKTKEIQIVLKDSSSYRMKKVPCDSYEDFSDGARQPTPPFSQIQYSISDGYTQLSVPVESENNAITRFRTKNIAFDGINIIAYENGKFIVFNTQTGVTEEYDAPFKVSSFCIDQINRCMWVIAEDDNLVFLDCYPLHGHQSQELYNFIKLPRESAHFANILGSDVISSSVFEEIMENAEENMKKIFSFNPCISQVAAISLERALHAKPEKFDVTKMYEIVSNVPINISYLLFFNNLDFFGKEKEKFALTLFNLISSCYSSDLLVFAFNRLLESDYVIEFNTEWLTDNFEPDSLNPNIINLILIKQKRLIFKAKQIIDENKYSDENNKFIKSFIDYSNDLLSPNKKGGVYEIMRKHFFNNIIILNDSRIYSTLIDKIFNAVGSDYEYFFIRMSINFLNGRPATDFIRDNSWVIKLNKDIQEKMFDHDVSEEDKQHLLTDDVMEKVHTKYKQNLNKNLSENKKLLDKVSLSVFSLYSKVFKEAANYDAQTERSKEFNAALNKMISIRGTAKENQELVLRKLLYLLRTYKEEFPMISPEEIANFACSPSSIEEIINSTRSIKELANEQVLSIKNFMKIINGENKINIQNYSMSLVEAINWSGCKTLYNCLDDTKELDDALFTLFMKIAKNYSNNLMIVLFKFFREVTKCQKFAKRCILEFQKHSKISSLLFIEMSRRVDEYLPIFDDRLFCKSVVAKNVMMPAKEIEKSLEFVVETYTKKNYEKMGIIDSLNVIYNSFTTFEYPQEFVEKICAECIQLVGQGIQEIVYFSRIYSVLYFVRRIINSKTNAGNIFKKFIQDRICKDDASYSIGVFAIIGLIFVHDVPNSMYISSENKSQNETLILVDGAKYKTPILESLYSAKEKGIPTSNYTIPPTEEFFNLIIHYFDIACSRVDCMFTYVYNQTLAHYMSNINFIKACPKDIIKYVYEKVVPFKLIRGDLSALSSLENQNFKITSSVGPFEALCDNKRTILLSHPINNNVKGFEVNVEPIDECIVGVVSRHTYKQLTSYTYVKVETEGSVKIDVKNQLIDGKIPFPEGTVFSVFVIGSKKPTIVPDDQDIFNPDITLPSVEFDDFNDIDTKKEPFVSGYAKSFSPDIFSSHTCRSQVTIEVPRKRERQVYEDISFIPFGKVSVNGDFLYSYYKSRYVTLSEQCASIALMRLFYNITEDDVLFQMIPDEKKLHLFRAIINALEPSVLSKKFTFEMHHAIWNDTNMAQFDENLQNEMAAVAKKLLPSVLPKLLPELIERMSMAPRIYDITRPTLYTDIKNAKLMNYIVSLREGSIFNSVFELYLLIKASLFASPENQFIVKSALLRTFIVGGELTEEYQMMMFNFISKFNTPQSTAPPGYIDLLNQAFCSIKNGSFEFNNFMDFERSAYRKREMPKVGKRYPIRMISQVIGENYNDIIYPCLIFNSKLPKIEQNQLAYLFDIWFVIYAALKGQFVAVNPTLVETNPPHVFNPSSVQFTITIGDEKLNIYNKPQVTTNGGWAIQRPTGRPSSAWSAAISSSYRDNEENENIPFKPVQSIPFNFKKGKEAGDACVQNFKANGSCTIYPGIPFTTNEKSVYFSNDTQFKQIGFKLEKAADSESGNIVVTKEMLEQFEHDCHLFACEWSEDDSKELYTEIIKSQLYKSRDAISEIIDFTKKLPLFKKYGNAAIMRTIFLTYFHSIIKNREANQQSDKNRTAKKYTSPVEASILKSILSVDEISNELVNCIETDQKTFLLYVRDDEPIFPQVANKLKALNWHVRHSTKPFDVRFVGRKGINEGGLTRQLLTMTADSLFNDDLGIVTPIPNKKEFFVPIYKPGKDDFLRAIGAYIGIILRTGNKQDIPFAPFIWKMILNEQVTMEDMKFADPFFSLHYEKGERRWNYIDWDGKCVLLKDHTEDEVVNEEDVPNCLYHCMKSKLNSLAKPVMLIREGFLENIGISRNFLLTAKNLSEIVQGDPHITFDQFMAITKFKNFGTSNGKEYFIRLLKESDESQIKQIFFFITSLRRINSKVEITIEQASSRINEMPNSHTCFNKLSFPMYSSYEKCKTLVLAAVRNCDIIDAI